jgi:hypothetical protein
MLLATLPFIKNMLDKRNKKEKFQQLKASVDGVSLLWGIINLLVGLYALYLSFSRNQGIDLGSLLVAFCCSWCYVAYALAVPLAPRINVRNNTYRF